MKKLYLLILPISMSLTTLGQIHQKNSNVGVNTEDPQETLDVNGHVKVRKMKEPPSINDHDVVVIDKSGKLWRISIDDLRNSLKSTSYIEPKLCPGVKTNCKPNDLRGLDIPTAKAGDKICWGGLQYEVISFRNRLWLDRNLGATRPDDEIKIYGDLYQWGRFGEGHQCLTDSDTTDQKNRYDKQATSPDPDPTQAWYGKVIIPIESDKVYDDWLHPSADSLWSAPEYTNNPCPIGFRVPTIDEWKDLLEGLPVAIGVKFWTSTPVENKGTSYFFHDYPPPTPEPIDEVEAKPRKDRYPILCINNTE